MKTITTVGTVNENGILTVDTSSSLSPGKHKITIIIDDDDTQEDPKKMLYIPSFPIKPKDLKMTYRREDIY